jgi:hypothetical protein
VEALDYAVGLLASKASFRPGNSGRSRSASPVPAPTAAQRSSKARRTPNGKAQRLYPSPSPEANVFTWRTPSVPGPIRNVAKGENPMRAIGGQSLNWTRFVGSRSLVLRCDLAHTFLRESSCFLLVCLCCGFVVNAFALPRRGGISTALAAASILSMPARHTNISVVCSSSRGDGSGS